MKTIDGRLVCPREEEGGRLDLERETAWRDDKTCNFCGSLDPEEFFRRVEAGHTVIPTDKNYKAYVRESNDGQQSKVYFQHFDSLQQAKFVDLFNAKKITIGYPHHFYVLPFFMVLVKKDETH